MKTIYFYFFLFYDKVLRLSNPRTMATLVLSACQAFFIIRILELILNIRYGKKMLFNQGIFIILAMIAINYFYFHFGKKARARNIEKTKPKFFNNNILTIIITILFFLSTFLLMILSADIAKIIFNKYCK